MFVLTVRGTVHRGSRLLLTALAVASGVALVSGALLLADGTRRAYALAVTQRTNGVDVYVRGPETDRRQGISDFAPVANSTLATVKAVPGVRVAAGQVVRLAELASPQGNFYAAGRPLYGYSWPGDPSLAAYRLTFGRAPLAPGEAVVDAATAREAGLRVGSPVLAGLGAQSPRPATLVGLVAPIQSADLSAPAAVVVSAGWAQEMVGVGDSWDLLEVAAVPGVSADALRARVTAALPPDGTAAITRREYIEAQVDALASRSQAIDLLVVLLAAGALLAAIATVFNTFAISLRQRREELSLMRSVGLTQRQVYAVLVGEGLLVGLVASAIGAGASVPVATGLGALVASTVGGPRLGAVSLVPWAVVVAAGIGVISAVAAAGWTA
ncbi:MAG TPA: ABC transporter permease, partial [Candidatus Dormibacteraeota bacterium]